MAEESGASEPSVVPPPPPSINDRSSGGRADVLIRTMASDIRMLGQSGGAAPQGESVTIELATPSGHPPAAGTPRNRLVGARTILIAATALIAAGVLFYLGYAILPTLFAGSAPEEAAPAQGSVDERSALSGQTDEAVYFGHQSFFRTAADAITPFVFDVLGVAYSPSLFAPQMHSTLSSVPESAQMIEVRFETQGERALTWTELMDTLRIMILDKDYFSSRFEDDFTAYAYRIDMSETLGYILKLQKNQSPIVLRSAVQDGIETHADAVQNLFLSLPTDMPTTYKDVRISGQLARRAVFGEQEFVYGWFYNTYLILGTSEAGVREAVLRL